MRAAVLSWQTSEHASTNPRQELVSYLSSPVEDVDDVVKWWGVSVSYLSLNIAQTNGFLVPLQSISNSGQDC
jgi:hypothetical protein